MKGFVFLAAWALLPALALAQSEADQLRLQNYELRMEIMARDFNEIKTRRDELKARIDKQAKETAEKKAAEKQKTD